MSISTWGATSGDWDDSKFSQAWDGPAISVAKGNLTLSSTAPGGGVSPFFYPSVASFEIVQSYEWDQLTTTWVATPGTWSSGPVPQVAVGSAISPDNATLTFTGYSPTPGIMYDFRITASSLTFSGILPAAGEGWVISPESASIEIIQTYNWNNYGGTWADAPTDWANAGSPFIPTAIETAQNQPDAGSLTLTGSIPISAHSIGLPIPVGSLAFTGYAPPFGVTHFRSPEAADLTGLGGGPLWDNVTGDWASHTEAWGFGTLAPSFGITYIFSIDSSGNLVFTPYEPKWPLVRDPNYIAEVILS